MHHSSVASATNTSPKRKRGKLPSLPSLALRASVRYGILLLAMTGCIAPKTLPPIVIGHIAPRTGPLREQGLAAEAAIRLAVTAANDSEEKVAGRTLEVRHPDNAGKPEAAQSVAVRLLAVGNLAALIGDGDSASAERLCRLAGQYKTPVLAPVWLPPAALGAYGFSIGSSPADRGQALARAAVEQLGACEVLVLTDTRSPEFLALTAAFVEQVGSKARVRRLDFSSDDDLLQHLQREAGNKHAAVLAAGNVADLERVHGLLRGPDPGERPPVLLYGGPEDARLARLADAWSEGRALYWTMAFAPDALTPQALAFARAYEARTQRPPDAAALLAYDAAGMLITALRGMEGAKDGKVKLRDELLKLKDYESLSGPLTFDKNQAVSRPVSVVHRVGDRVQTLRPSAK